MPVVSDELPGRARRRGWMPLGISSVALSGVVLLGCLGYLRWANTLPPPEPDPRPMPSPNGFDAGMAAARKLTPIPIAGREEQWLAAHVQAVRQAAGSDSAALDELRAAARAEVRFPNDGDGRDPAFAPLNNALRRLIASSKVALEDGDRSLAVERALTGLEYGSRLGRAGLLYYGLVSPAAARVILDRLEPCVDGLSAAEARAAGRRVDAVLARLPAHADVARGQRRFALARFARELENGGPQMLPQRGVPKGLDHPSLRPLLWQLYPKPAAYRAADRYYQALIAETEKPFASRGEPPPPEEPLARDWVAGVDRTFPQLLAAETAVVLLRLELALQEYRKKAGRYPDRLEALAPTVLSAIPCDPFTGKPFIYRRSGARYMLYSVGPDLKDDGGRAIVVRRYVPGPGDLVAEKAARSMSQRY